MQNSSRRSIATSDLRQTPVFLLLPTGEGRGEGLLPLDGELFELVFGDHGNCRSGDLRLNKQVVDFVCFYSSQRKCGGLRLNENQAQNGR